MKKKRKVTKTIKRTFFVFYFILFGALIYSLYINITLGAKNKEMKEYLDEYRGLKEEIDRLDNLKDNYDLVKMNNDDLAKQKSSLEEKIVSLNNKINNLKKSIDKLK